MCSLSFRIEKRKTSLCHMCLFCVVALQLNVQENLHFLTGWQSSECGTWRSCPGRQHTLSIWTTVQQIQSGSRYSHPGVNILFFFSHEKKFLCLSYIQVQSGFSSSLRFSKFLLTLISRNLIRRKMCYSVFSRVSASCEVVTQGFFPNSHVFQG